MAEDSKSLLSPGKRLTVNAPRDEGPICLITFCITEIFPVCFAVNSSLTSQTFSSILEIIESVNF